MKLAIKIILTALIAAATPYLLLYFLVLVAFGGYIEAALLLLLIPALIPLIWIKKRKVYLIIYLCVFLALSAISLIHTAIDEHEESITIDVTPNIDVNEYLPFVEDTKIVKIDSKMLKLTDNLPRIDGASAAFPVYSAFVNAVYPDTTELHDGIFEYSSTSYGYQRLAQKEIDIFIGAGPSAKQKEFAKECGTTLEYTQIGWEAFVFFVHKDNPIDSLTIEQIKGIYSGEITNWSEVGGANEEIAAFQRDEGSGSQSMMLRFMGDTPLKEAETETIQGMGAVIERVVDYKSKSGSIGYSFRYYIEGIIQNPDIKMIAIEGIAPTAENVRNNKYPIITPVYAVTYEGNTNENVDRLVAWMLSEEGQYIIEETGYVGMSK